MQRRGLAAYSNGTSPFCCGRFGPTGGQYREVCLGEVWCLFNVARTVISAKPLFGPCSWFLVRRAVLARNSTGEPNG